MNNLSYSVYANLNCINVKFHEKYYQGFWKIPFKEELTVKGEFDVDEDTVVTVKYMRKNDFFHYHYSSVLQADMAELPYEPDGEILYIRMKCNVLH